MSTFKCYCPKGRCLHGPQQHCKVILLGDLNVGKTSLFRKIASADLLHSRDTLLGGSWEDVGIDQLEKVLTLRQGEQIQLNLWDTGGVEAVRSSMVKNYYHHADAVILVYDMSESNPVANLRDWMEDVISNTTDEMIFMLVGNKMDMQKSSVNQSLGDKFAVIHSIPDNLHFKISVKESSQEELMEMIVSLVQHIHDNRQETDQIDQDSIRLDQPLIDTNNKESKCCLRT